MDVLIICLAALIASGLTFFSGFGLGTILTPVFLLFFPVDLAIALTAVVHLLNNLFKMALVGKHMDIRVVLRFGIPAILTAYLGARTLVLLAGMPDLFSYWIGNRLVSVTPVKLTIALLLLMFALAEVLPAARRIQFGKVWLIPGGLLSGFFGGLSGVQGAVRSAFLIKAGLTKETYIATGTAIACVIDVSRLLVYAPKIIETNLSDYLHLLIPATLAAMAGAMIGNVLLKKITLRFVQMVVAGMLFLIALALGFGLV